MALILNLETATRNCSVALAKDGNILTLNEIAGEGYLHSEKLHLFIRKALDDAGYAFKDIDAVAVGMGPGSYTGLRIGVSAAKGICYALGVPLVAVDTLEILACQITVSPGEFIVPLIDARRMEAYTALFDSQYNKITETTAEVILPETFSRIGGVMHLLGDGTAKCKALLTDERFVYHDDILFPSAAQMCTISHDKIKIGDTVDVAYFEPFYLKDFVAIKKL
jgi:tRNA threonylcarbamoyladenosine biosynthesis protein TsaB